MNYMFELSTVYPFWFILFCFLVGIVYAFALYYRDKQLNELAPWLKWLMAFFRFLSVTILSFFLLHPLLKIIFREVEKPVIIIAQDNSSSILACKDSLYYKEKYKEELEELVNDLQKKYTVKTFSFGDKVKSGLDFSYDQKQTDLSFLMEELENKVTNRNIGAVLVASDGIYNKGAHPLYAAEQFHVPVYTIAMGDTSPRKDIFVAKVEHNHLAYLGNDFPVQVIIGARELKAKQSILTVSQQEKVLFSQNISVNSDRFVLAVPLRISATQTGLQRFKVSIKTVDGEINTVNNYTDFFVEVMDGREKILILTEAPHPDIRALKSALETSQNYDVTSEIIQEFDKPLKGFNLLVLHQLPSLTNDAQKWIAEAKAANIPVWYFLGNKSALPKFNGLNAGISIDGVSAKNNEAEAVPVMQFSLFTLSDHLLRYADKFPVITCPFGNYEVSNGASVLFRQRIGMVQTNTPLMLFLNQDQQKQAVFCGEGIWRWKLRDYADNGSNEIFNELISKTVQYLSIKVDKSFFRVTCKSNFMENEVVEMEAEVYNDSYELITTPEVTVDIINAAGKRFPFNFNKTANAYRLNAGNLAVGDYRFEARVKTNGKDFVRKGTFSVSPLHVETTNIVADHQLLHQLANKSGGKMVYPTEMKKLVDLLNQRNDIKSVSYTENRLNDLINIRWIFFLLLFLLSAEWFLRKRNGAY